MTTFTSSNAFDLVEFDTQSGADDLMSSLAPTLLNSKMVDFQADERLGDSPDSYVSNSSSDDISASNPIEDFDLYDFGANTSEFNSCGEPFKFSGSHQQQQQQQDATVDSFLKDFSQQDKPKTVKSQQQSPVSPPAQFIFPQQAMITPQQIQEQFMLLQQQQRAQMYASAYGAQMPFAPFMNPFAQHIPTFIASSPSPTAVSTSPVQDTVKSTKQQETTSSKKKKKTTTTAATTTSAASSNTSTNSSNSSNASRKRARETNNHSPSDALAELESKTPATVEEDKEIKRQRRLIKNRESAQASRERKKIYVKGLESKVEDLTNKNASLSSKLEQLEEENRRLKERLSYLDPTIGMQEMMSASVEPDAKKRRLSNVPIVPKQLSTFTYNPFDANFWSSFMGGAQIQPQQAQPVVQQVPVWQPVHSKRVVMFIMIFCVAVMLVFPKDNLSSSLTTSSSNAVVEEQQQLAVGSVNKKSMGRSLLFESEADPTINEARCGRLKDLYDQFGRLASVKPEVKEEIEAFPFKLSVQLNQTDNSLQISIPLDSLAKSPAKTVVVKQEPKEDDDVDMDSKECSATSLEHLTWELINELTESSSSS